MKSDGKGDCYIVIVSRLLGVDIILFRISIFYFCENLWELSRNVLLLLLFGFYYQFDCKDMKLYPM